ncbi:MAG: aminotransferase class I/II-fold pyridoxal phosphate-dependent enzyme [bacterium]|nr:aminotransferase class I/II-fold pyridoxal phosphate-dependent enzyme [bacterium]
MDSHTFLARHIVDLPKSGIREFFDIVSTRKGVISLAIGEPDFDTPWHIREATINSLENGLTHYTGNAGLIELRSEIASYVKRKFGGTYDPADEVLITVGASEGIDITLRALLNPGDEVLYHEPCFVSYAPGIAMAHGVPVPVETFVEDNFRLNVEALEAKVTPRTKILMLNFPNNPTGAILEAEDVRAIADFAIRHNLIVLSDEIYAELTWGGKKHTSFASIPELRDRLVLFHGYSKAWAMTGYRMAYICAPRWMMDTILKIHQYAIMCAPTPSQYGALEAMRQPEEDMAPMLRAYEQRRNFLHAAFAEAGIPMHNPAGAFYAFPQIEKFGLSARDFALRLLDAENVAVVPGTAFGACGEGFVRCSYATSMEQLREALSRISRFVKTL